MYQINCKYWRLNCSLVAFVQNLTYFNLLGATETFVRISVFISKFLSFKKKTNTFLKKFSAVAKLIYFSAIVFPNELEISSFITVLMTSYKVIKLAAGKCNLATTLLNLPFTSSKLLSSSCHFLNKFPNRLFA